MNRMDLYEGIGELDEDLLERSEINRTGAGKPGKRRRRYRMGRTLTAAAAFLAQSSGPAGRRITLIYRPPSGEINCSAFLPAPRLCRIAITVVPCGAPATAYSFAVRFVDGSSSKTCTLQPSRLRQRRIPASETTSLSSERQYPLFVTASIR